MNLHKSRRKLKRRLNWLQKHACWGSYVIDCRGQPCCVVGVERYTNDPYGNGIYVESIIDGSSNSCSLLHCGPEPITEAEARRLANEP